MNDLPAAVLMAPPDFFEVRDVKNDFMRGRLGSIDRARAAQQWNALRETFERCNVATHVLPPVPQCEDMVFTANPSFNGRTAAGERLCVPGRMAFPSRQPEVDAHRGWFDAHGYRIADLPPEIERFEGGGDALWHPGRARIWAGAGPRTQREAHPVLAELFGVEVTTLELSGSPFYHLDTCFCALDERTVLIHPNAFTQSGLKAIHAAFADVIDVDEAEAATVLACNAAAFPGKYVVIQRGAAQTTMELERRGFAVFEVETGEFLKSGGSVFCMKAGVY